MSSKTNAAREVHLALAARAPEPKTGLALMRERIASLESTQIEIAAKTTVEKELEELEEKPFSAHRLWQLTMAATGARTTRVIDHIQRRAQCQKNAERRRLEAELRAKREQETLRQAAFKRAALRQTAREQRLQETQGEETNVDHEGTKG